MPEQPELQGDEGEGPIPAGEYTGNADELSDPTYIGDWIRNQLSGITSRRHPAVPSHHTFSVSMIPRATSGSGCRIAGTRAMRVRPPLAWRGKERPAPGMWSGAVPGAPAQDACARRSATGAGGGLAPPQGFPSRPGLITLSRGPGGGEVPDDARTEWPAPPSYVPRLQY